MAYIGVDINYGNIAKQTGTGDGSDTTPIAALTYTVPSNESILVFLDGVAQVPGTDFTATGTTLTFTTAPANGVAILVMFLGRSLDIGTPGDSTVATAKIANNAVDETKLKDALIGDFTDVTVTAADTFLYGDTTDSGNTKKDTVQGILDLASSGPTLGTEQATTSGDTARNFTIPSGTKLIYVMFDEVSLSGTGVLQVQLGDSGGIETSGYISTSAKLVSTASVTTTQITHGFVMHVEDAAGITSGIMTLALVNSSDNTWVSSHSNKCTTAIVSSGGGTKSLSGELTQIQFLDTASDTFDAGAVNILYF